jgi:S-ribosylhomocysteine lyase LuxS involved in autoinducer biosynthesis
MVEKVAKIKVPTAGFYGGKQMHGLRHVEARFLKKHIQTKMVLVFRIKASMGARCLLSRGDEKIIFKQKWC